MEENQKTNDQANGQDKPAVVIYSTPTCHFCNLSKAFFKDNKIEYTEYNVAEDDERRNEMIEKSGQLGVPVVFVGEEMIVGFDEPKLKELLGL